MQTKISLMTVYYIKSCIFLLLYLCFDILAAQSRIDKDTAQIKLKTELSDRHREQLKFHLQQINTAVDSVTLAATHNKIAIVYLESTYYVQSPKYDSVLYHVSRAIKLTKNEDHAKAKKIYLEALGWLGSCYVDLGNKSKAINIFNEILTKTENTKHPDMFYGSRELATTYMAIIYAWKNNTELAVKQYESLIDYVAKNQIDTNNISSIMYIKLAGFYREMNCLNMAFEYANKAVAVAHSNNFLFRVAMAYTELATIKLVSKEFDTAEIYLLRAFNILKNEQEYPVLLARYYVIKSSLAMNYGNVSQQVHYAERAFELLNNKNPDKLQIRIGKLLSEAYKRAGNFEKAFEVLENTIVLEKKLINSEEIKKNISLEIERRDTRIAYEQHQKRLEQVKGQRKTFIIGIVLLLFLFSIIVTWLLFMDRKKKVKLALLTEDKNEQLKELDFAKSRFFANISHELRTPLTLISSPLQHILDISEEDLPIKTKNTMELMRRNVAKLQKMVNEILCLSKLESGKAELQQQPIECNSFLQNVASSFESFNFSALGIQYSYDIKLSQSMWVLLDLDKVEKILTNLVSNAFKNVGSGDEVILTSRLEKDLLLVDVRDTGKGIDASDLPYVFDRFYQGKNTGAATLKQGTGIGLSISKEFAILMGGTLKVKSQLNKGSVFTLQIPVKETKLRTNSGFPRIDILEDIDAFDSNEYSAKEELEKDDCTILIVEDDPDMLQFINELMKDKFYIYEAHNGIEGLDVLKKHNIDLIISDIMMPEMDGYDFLERLKENDEHRNIPVIMLTALGRNANKLKALTIGVDDYLTKPFLPRELISRAENQLLNNQRRKKWNKQNELIENNTDDSHLICNLNSVTKRQIEWIHKIQDRVREELENDTFRLSQLAKEMFISDRQFQRRIKKITGLSPKQLQQEIALQKARELLEDNAYANLTAIAYSVGMYNVTRFSKKYETRFGKKPSEYF